MRFTNKNVLKGQKYKSIAVSQSGHLSLVCQKQKYAPSVFEKYVTTISVGGKEIKLNLYDTAGKTLYQKSPPCGNSRDAFFSISTGRHNVERQQGVEHAELSDHTVSFGWNIKEIYQFYSNNTFIYIYIKFTQCSTVCSVFIWLF